MPTSLSHAIAGAALAALYPRAGPVTRLWVAGALCAVVPDGDIVSVWLGIPWGHVLGHRGITHSLAFAVVLAAVVTATVFRGRAWDGRRGLVWLFLFVATASHGVLDSMTNGGSGVAFLAPFDDTRYVAPWRPIPVSPISIRRFMSQWGIAILRTEALVIWLPAAGLAGLGALLRRRARRGP
jgi:inner membrane protein